MPRFSSRLAIALVAATLSLSGCFLIAAGAGAAGAIAYTNRGASSTLDGSVDQVFDRGVGAFGAMNITETGRSTEESGRKRRLVGTRGELEITVELNRETDTTTKVEVIASRNLVDYDRELAREVLNRMLAAR